MNDPLTEIYFWSQVIGDSKRTVICSPDLESRVKGWVEARGMGGIITVQAERFVPDDRLYIMDTPAMEAYERESFQQSMRDWQRSLPWRSGDLRPYLGSMGKFWRGTTEG